LARVFEKEIELNARIQIHRNELADRYDFDIVSLFRTIDEERFGSLNFDTIALFFRNNDIPISEAEILAILRRLDKDTDGKISYSEFHDAIQGKTYPLRHTSPSRISSPTRRVASPLRNSVAYSPSRRVASPTRKVASPLRTSIISSPTRRVASPTRRVASPLRQQLLLHQQEKLPLLTEANPIQDYQHLISSVTLLTSFLITIILIISMSLLQDLLVQDLPLEQIDSLAQLLLKPPHKL